MTRKALSNRRKDSTLVIMCCVLILLTIFLGSTAAIQETTNVKVCSNNRSFTLSPWPGYLQMGDSDVTMIYVTWSRLNMDSNNWTEVFHWHYYKGCLKSTETLANGTRVRCSSDGKLIVDHSDGRSTRKSARYLLVGRLSNGSDVHHFYEVEFIECLKTGVGASINLIDEIEKLLPCDAQKRLIELRFLDINNTYIARYKPGHCCDLTNFESIRTFPWLSWTSRLNNTGGKLELTRIQATDNLRDFQVRVILCPLKRQIRRDRLDISLRILVDSSQGSQLSVTHKTHTLRLSTFKRISQPSTEDGVTRTSPTRLMSSSARAPEKYWTSAVALVVLQVTVAKYLRL